NLNAHYLRETDDAELLTLVTPGIEAALGRPMDDVGRDRVQRGLSGVKQRSRTIPELAGNLVFYARHGVPPLDEKARALLEPPARELLDRIAKLLTDPQRQWTEALLEAAVKGVAEQAGIKLGQVAQPLRAALTGSTVSPGIFEVLAILGRE